MEEAIHFYHINDLHSHFEKWPRIHAFFEKSRLKHQRRGEEVFYFDLGDHADRWHPFTEGTMGKGNVSLLNKDGMTAATIGNNEGITFPKDQLNQLYENAAFDVIVANLYEPNGKRPPWALPYQIYKTKSNVKIGVIAVTAFFSEVYKLLGWEITEPIAEIRKQLKALVHQTDMIMLLSHLGIHQDEKIAKLFHEIDIIIGAHTHHVLPKGKIVDQSLLAAAGKFGLYVGHITVKIDTDSKQVIDKQATLYETNKMEKPHNEEAQIAELERTGKQLLQKEIVRLPYDLTGDWFESSRLSQLLCEAICHWTDADCAFINAGVIMKSLKKGVVTQFDIHEMLPHPINPCLFELTGEEIRTVLLHSLNEDWAHFPLKGLGFRGKVMGKFVYHSIHIDEKSGEVFVNDKLIELDHTYKLATFDLFAFGKFFPILHKTKKKRYFMPEFLRDIMAWKLKAEFLS